MTIFEFFLSILVILLGLYALAATAVILILYPNSPSEVPRFIKWCFKYGRTALREWLKKTNRLIRVVSRRWWSQQGWHVVHMFWLTVSALALYGSIWVVYITLFWNENDR